MTDQPYETFEVNGHVVKLYQDTEPGAGNPRDADNLGVMLANGHRNYVLGDEHFKNRIPEYNPATRILDEILDDKGFRRGQIAFETVARRFKDELGATMVLPLWVLDHSGLAMRTTTFFEDPGNWDSGVVGFIFDTPRTREMCGTPPDRVEEVLQDEVKLYDMYLHGDVWGYVIENPDGKQVESCWGILDFDNCKEEARAAAGALVPVPNPDSDSDSDSEEVNAGPEAAGRPMSEGMSDEELRAEIEAAQARIARAEEVLRQRRATEDLEGDAGH